jgi:hypothetical protein
MNEVESCYIPITINAHSFLISLSVLVGPLIQMMKLNSLSLMFIAIILVLVCSAMFPVYLYTILEMKISMCLIPIMTMITVLFMVMHMNDVPDMSAIQFILLGFILLLVLEMTYSMHLNYTRFKELFEDDVMSISWDLSLIAVTIFILHMFNVLIMTIYTSTTATRFLHMDSILTFLMISISPYYLLLSIHRSRLIFMMISMMIVLRMILSIVISMEINWVMKELNSQILNISLTAMIFMSMIMHITMVRTPIKGKYQFLIKRRGVSIFRYKNWEPGNYKH